jgi:hypothetical protein
LTLRLTNNTGHPTPVTTVPVAGFHPPWTSRDSIPITPGDSDHAPDPGTPMRRDRRRAFNPLERRRKVRLYGKPMLHECDLCHIVAFEPVLSLQHQNVMHANAGV